MKKYASDEEVLDIVRRFENCEYAREEWRHADHLIVGLCYVLQNEETAYEKMRGGIFQLLKSFGVDFSSEMPYHETLTVFWLRQIGDFTKSRSRLPLVEIANELIEKLDKNHPLRFYSREVLFSETARREFVEPDQQNF